MSRVFRGERYVNMPHHDPNITAPSKVVRVHCEGEDYHKATSLTSWLFMKYDMSFKTYRGKSKQRRDELRQEYLRDTHTEWDEYLDDGAFYREALDRLIREDNEYDSEPYDPPEDDRYDDNDDDEEEEEAKAFHEAVKRQYEE